MIHEKGSVTKRLLVVDKDASVRTKLQAGLESVGFTVDAVSSAEAAIAALEKSALAGPANDYALLVTDLQLDEESGAALTKHVRTVRPELPVIVTATQSSVKSAIEAMKSGVWDYITKPLAVEELELQASRAIRHAQLATEVKSLRREVGERVAVRLIGHSVAVEALREMAARVAKSDVSALIMGESGTGKEVVARTIHDLSSRAGGPFVAVNCAALPESLLESELFGHVKGAFTDARKSRRGLFLEADGGTLLLDEIGEMPLLMQPKLLRALQERVVRPVGSDEAIPFDTRVIATTNRDLVEAVEQRTFREDLFYRLNVVQIDMPPLRTRGNDILLMALTFVDRFAKRHQIPVRGISAEAGERLLRHDWPGNVRELMNVIERGVALTRSDLLQVEDLPPRVREATSQRLEIHVDDPDEIMTLDELEQRYITKILAQYGGNKSHAARVLGVDRKTLLRKLKRSDDGAVEPDEPLDT